MNISATSQILLMNSKYQTGMLIVNTDLAYANTPSITTEFDFTNREALELVEKSIGIIQFNQFSVLLCASD